MEFIALFLVLGILTIVFGAVALSLLGGVASAVLGVGTALLFTVGPIVLVGWAVWKLAGGGRRDRALSPADRHWLEHGDR